ncbi:hypothetical protein P5V15_015794 [Pogonomyrmex californicus]
MAGKFDLEIFSIVCPKDGLLEQLRALLKRLAQMRNVFSSEDDLEEEREEEEAQKFSYSTGYKFLNVCVTLERSSRVNIILGDSHGKEVSMSPDTWRQLVEQRHVLSKYLQSINGEPSFPAPSHIGNMTVRFGKINNLTILRLETSAARLAMSKKTVNNMFELEHCISRLVISLTKILGKIDAKLARFKDIAFTAKDTENISRVIRDSDAYDRNDIIDCELVALYIGM